MELEELRTLLAPVKGQLERLKGTKIPPQNGRVAAKSAMQILKERLIPVGRYVLQRVAGMENHKQGAAEAQICEYVAEHYWPQNLVQVHGFRVMEIYRNAIYLERLAYERQIAEDEAEVRRLQALEYGYVDDEEEETPALMEGGGRRLQEDEEWVPHEFEDAWGPVDTDEEMWRSEVTLIEDQDEDEEGGVSLTDVGSWGDRVGWSWGRGQSRGG